MIVHEIKLRVRYAETDKMGFAYYGNYATYFEVARVETMRKAGISYRNLEDEGILLPVSRYSVEFRKPAFYDEELTVKVTVPEMPGVRFKFDYETFNEKGERLNTAHTTLVFTDKKTGKAMRIPPHIEQKLKAFFD